MKNSSSISFIFGVVFLFFIQLVGTLVEAIYILDLMNAKLDGKVLGLLFFFAPILLLPFYRKFPRGLVCLSFAILLLARGILPYVNTANRALASGLGVFAALSLFFLLLVVNIKGESERQSGLQGSAGLALAVSLSVLLRTVGYGLDYSLTPAGGWVGWGLGLVLGGMLLRLAIGDQAAKRERDRGGVTPALLGVFLILTLVWFAFSAPAVLARWTEGNYPMIVITISLLAAGWGVLSLGRPQLFDRLSRPGLLLWNLLFTLCLTGTIVAHRVSFPPTPESAPVIVTGAGWFGQLPPALTLLLFPVIFFDMRLFLNQIRQAAPAPGDLAAGILLGGSALILLVFTHILANVWGYVQPLSLLFRNTFWLSYFLLTASITLLVWWAKWPRPFSDKRCVESFHWPYTLLLGAIFLGAAIRVPPTKRLQTDATDRSSLVAMTLNSQQFNDPFAEKSYERQLALIRKVSPEILALQESDSARISLNNNDYVRYFAERLGYYSYYGPSTVTGAYGTAILSKFPLLNTRTVFTYSDKDEIGVAEAEFEVSGRRFIVYNVHPDGSDVAMLVFAKSLLQRSKDKANVIALGDYNLREDEEAYRLIDRVYTNAWSSIHPAGISADEADMPGVYRIDHIFVSPGLGVRNPIYVPSPESASDHPAHWTEIFWRNP